jgi:trehalose 6-phosphate phosphatase
VRTPAGAPLSVPAAVPAEVTDALAAFAAVKGLHFERKAHGAALHYRDAPEREADAHRFADDLAAAHGLAVKAGKCVVELVAPGADKGSAVALLAGRPPFAGACPVFIGDDLTDEDGFAACAQRGGFGIAVGERPATGARYRLGAVSDVYEWLAL